MSHETPSQSGGESMPSARWDVEDILQIVPGVTAKLIQSVPGLADSAALEGIVTNELIRRVALDGEGIVPTIIDIAARLGGAIDEHESAVGAGLIPSIDDTVPDAGSRVESGMPLAIEPAAPEDSPPPYQP